MASTWVDIFRVYSKAWSLNFLVSVLIGCSNGLINQSEKNAEQLCEPAHIIGKYVRGYDLGTLYTLNLDSSKKFSYSTFTDVGAKEQTQGVYKILHCTIKLAPEKFNGQLNFHVILDRRFMAYSLGNDIYLVPPEDTSAFQAATKKGKGALTRLVHETVFEKIGEHASASER